MKNKGLTLLAHNQIINQYEDVKIITPETFYNDCSEFFAHSPLCRIHVYNNERGYYNNCKGCPLADVTGKAGCIEFESFINAIDSFHVFFKEYQRDGDIHFSFNKMIKTFQKMAEFHRQVISVLKEIDEVRFTKDGWSFFSELDQVEERKSYVG